jgi:hypothetical protein
VKAIKEKADAYYAGLYQDLQAKRAEGMSLQAIADYLNGNGEVTRNKKPWNKVQVRAVLIRGERLLAN